MADIAMLVAEEYERRVKIMKKIGAVEPKTTSFSFSASIEKLKEQSQKLFHETHLQIKVVDPKTDMAVAALHGSFSA